MGIRSMIWNHSRKKKWDKQKIARNLTRAIFRQIFVYRFFHADPHPGNIIVPAENKIAFIDFGLTGRVNEETRRWFVRMIQAVFMRDISALMQNMKKLVLFEKNIDEIEFQNDLERLVNEYYSSSLADVRLDKLFEEMFELTSLYDLKISSNLFLLMKCMITLESVVRQLDPEFEILKEIKVYLKNFLAEEYSPLSLLRGLRRFSTAFGDLVSEAPGRMTDIMRQVSHGNLKIQFELLGIDRLLSNLYRIVNRLIFSILAASLLIGSFFVLDSGMKPLIFGYPLFAELGFIFAIILIVIILFDIITYRDWHV